MDGEIDRKIDRSVGKVDNHRKREKERERVNHLSVHQWLRSATLIHNNQSRDIEET